MCFWYSTVTCNPKNFYVTHFAGQIIGAAVKVSLHLLLFFGANARKNIIIYIWMLLTFLIIILGCILVAYLEIMMPCLQGLSTFAIVLGVLDMLFYIITIFVAYEATREIKNENQKEDNKKKKTSLFYMEDLEMLYA